MTRRRDHRPLMQQPGEPDRTLNGGVTGGRRDNGREYTFALEPPE